MILIYQLADIGQNYIYTLYHILLREDKGSLKVLL